MLSKKFASNIQDWNYEDTAAFARNWRAKLFFNYLVSIVIIVVTFYAWR
jgi:hypothetical protein